MKPKKMNLKNIKDILSRDEMKAIMAGSGICGMRCPGTSVNTCYIDTALRCVCVANGQKKDCVPA